MSEQEPEIKLGLDDGGEFICRRDNTTLFRHLGANALYNHVFILVNENKGAYIFAENAGYPEIERLLIERKFPLHDNLLEVADCDLEAYVAMVTRKANEELEKGIPDDWL